MHKIPGGTSKMYTIPRELPNIHNPTWNFQKCTKSNEELPKMHKIQQGTSKNAQNPTRNFQKCTKSNEELPKMHKITGETSKYAQNSTRIFRKCTKSHD
jgi:hypothetical protein